MDGPKPQIEIVVELKGVTPGDAYAWGIEAGCFMIDAKLGKAEGPHVFHAGNMGMIEMIAVENKLNVDVIQSEDQFVLCHVTPMPKLRVVK